MLRGAPAQPGAINLFVSSMTPVTLPHLSVPSSSATSGPAAGTVRYRIGVKGNMAQWPTPNPVTGTPVTVMCVRFVARRSTSFPTLRGFFAPFVT